MMSVMQQYREQPTVFSAENHPTYKADLEKVSKLMPVASYESVATMAGGLSSDDDSSDTMSLQNGNDMDRSAELKAMKYGEQNVHSAESLLVKANVDAMGYPMKTTTTIEVALSPEYVKNVEKRDNLVKKLGSGEEYKLAKLAKLQQQKVMMNDEISMAESKWFIYDYETEGLEEACKTTARTDVVKKLGAGTSYKLHKLQKLEARIAPEVYEWDKWCHQDYDSADCLRQQ
jgi:hypothetical protein